MRSFIGWVPASAGTNGEIAHHTLRSSPRTRRSRAGHEILHKLGPSFRGDERELQDNCTPFTPTPPIFISSAGAEATRGVFHLSPKTDHRVGPMRSGRDRIQQPFL